MEIIEAKISDLELLTEMNIQLREDEKIDNILSFDQVKVRMNNFLTGNIYKTYLYVNNNIIYGYALIDFTKKPIYMRQLFIKNEYRNKGIGTKFFKNLLNKLDIKELDIEVMIWNEKAIRFYEKLGFKKRFLGLRLINN